jgi:hypothetical protein
VLLSAHPVSVLHPGGDISTWLHDNKICAALQ